MRAEGTRYHIQGKPVWDEVNQAHSRRFRLAGASCRLGRFGTGVGLLSSLAPVFDTLELNGINPTRRMAYY